MPGFVECPVNEINILLFHAEKAAGCRVLPFDMRDIGVQLLRKSQRKICETAGIIKTGGTAQEWYVTRRS